MNFFLFFFKLKQNLFVRYCLSLKAVLNTVLSKKTFKEVEKMIWQHAWSRRQQKTRVGIQNTHNFRFICVRAHTSHVIQRDVATFFFVAPPPLPRTDFFPSALLNVVKLKLLFARTLTTTLSQRLGAITLFVIKRRWRWHGKQIIRLFCRRQFPKFSKIPYYF